MLHKLTIIFLVFLFTLIPVLADNNNIQKVVIESAEVDVRYYYDNEWTYQLNVYDMWADPLSVSHLVNRYEEEQVTGQFPEEQISIAIRVLELDEEAGYEYLLQIGYVSESNDDVEEIRINYLDRTGTNYVVRTYRYTNSQWQYKATSNQWYYVGEQYQGSIPELSNELEGKNQQEGITIIQQHTENRDGELYYVRTSESTQQDSETAQDSEVNIPTVDECGVLTVSNSEAKYVELCYNQANMFPRQPRDFNTVIKDFVNQHIDSEQAGDGFAIIVYNDPQYIAASNARLRHLRAEVDKVLAKYPGENYRLVAGITEPVSANHRDRAYIIPDSAIHTNSNYGPFQHIIGNEILSTLRSTGSVEKAWQQQWTLTQSSIANDERVRDLIKGIADVHGINVSILYSDTNWQIQDKLMLEDQMRDVMRKNINDLTLNPCTAYFLVDPEGIHVHQSTRYCNVNLGNTRDDIMRDDVTEQLVQVLQRAYRHTQRSNFEDLMVAAYQLVTEGYELNEENEGLQLAKWAANNMHRDTTHPERAYSGATLTQAQASKAIVKARYYAYTADAQQALDILEEANPVEQAYPKMRFYGALVAVQSAYLLQDCDVLAQQYRKYQRYLDGRSEARVFLGHLRDCEYRELREKCEVMSTTQATTPQLQITFVNDGLGISRFKEISDNVARSLASTRNLNFYTDYIQFKRTTATATGLTTPTGELQEPRINSQAIARATSACHGDIAIVLSNAQYYPTTAGGNSYVSVAGCREDTRCMTIYAARSLGLSYFGMSPEENTVTAPLASNPRDSTLQQTYSFDQQEIISDILGPIPRSQSGANQ